MSDQRGPLFLGRGGYRQRRIADAARLLPILGIVLMMVPLLWRHDGSDAAPATSRAIIYLFGGLSILVLMCRGISSRMDLGSDTGGENGGESGGEVSGETSAQAKGEAKGGASVARRDETRDETTGGTRGKTTGGPPGAQSGPTSGGKPDQSDPDEEGRGPPPFRAPVPPADIGDSVDHAPAIDTGHGGARATDLARARQGHQGPEATDQSQTTDRRS